MGWYQRRVHGGPPFRQESQSEHTHKLTLRTAYIATCVTHAYETRHPSPINYTHVPRMAPQVNGEAPSSAFLSVRLPSPPFHSFQLSKPSSTTKSNTDSSSTAPHLLPRNQRLHLHLQIQPVRRQIPLDHHLPLTQTRGPTPPLPHQALPIRLSLHHQSRLPRRLHPLHHRLQVPRRQETYR